MSRAIIKTADQANNIYTVEISGIIASRSPVEIPAQCITRDELAAGSEVAIVDVNNQSPSDALGFDGVIRLLPNTGEFIYSTDKIWKNFDDIYRRSPNSAAYGFLYSSLYNPRWQKECPLYTFGNVTEIIDLKTLKVTAQMPFLKQYQWPELTCRTDYMTCNTDAFEIGDIAVIKFENSDINQPVCVGFWINPKNCYWEDWNSSNPSAKHYWISFVGFQATGTGDPREIPWTSNPFLASDGSYMKTENGWFESVARGTYGDPAKTAASNFLSSSITIFPPGPPAGVFPKDPMRYNAPNGIFEISLEADAGPDDPVPNILTSIEVVLYDANRRKYLILLASGSSQAEDYPVSFYDERINLKPTGTTQTISGKWEVNLLDYGWLNPGTGFFINQYAKPQDSILRIDYIDFK